MLNKKLDGFSLLEVAIVLCIIGIIAGFGLPVLTSMIKQKKARETEEHLAAAIQALTAYTLNYKRLPCPADAQSTSEKGQSIEKCLMSKTFSGILPFKTLGIPEKTAKDGYGNWLTYAVNLELTNPDIRYLSTKDETIPPPHVFCEVKAAEFNLEIKGADNLSVLDTSHKNDDFIAFVLVSHGPSQEGSFDQSGKRRPARSSLKEINANDSNPIYIDQPPSPDFDDSVRWVTRNNFMAIYGQKPCEKRDAS